VYIGYPDGVVSVYSILGAKHELQFRGSFAFHEHKVHSIFVYHEYKMLITTGLDSTLKIWEVPAQWDNQFVVTASMIDGVDPRENLSTIKEEKNESFDPESLLIRKPNLIGSEDFARGIGYGEGTGGRNQAISVLGNFNKK
jgi:hypothetical protein